MLCARAVSIHSGNIPTWTIILSWKQHFPHCWYWGQTFFLIKTGSTLCSYTWKDIMCKTYCNGASTPLLKRRDPGSNQLAAGLLKAASPLYLRSKCSRRDSGVGKRGEHSCPQGLSRYAYAAVPNLLVLQAGWIMPGQSVGLIPPLGPVQTRLNPTMWSLEIWWQGSRHPHHQIPRPVGSPWSPEDMASWARSDIDNGSFFVACFCCSQHTSMLQLHTFWKSLTYRLCLGMGCSRMYIQLVNKTVSTANALGLDERQYVEMKDDYHYLCGNIISHQISLPSFFPPFKCTNSGTLHLLALPQQGGSKIQAPDF